MTSSVIIPFHFDVARIPKELGEVGREGAWPLSSLGPLHDVCIPLFNRFTDFVKFSVNIVMLEHTPTPYRNFFIVFNNNMVTITCDVGAPLLPFNYGC
jgi:hypothetical protein